MFNRNYQQLRRKFNVLDSLNKNNLKRSRTLCRKCSKISLRNRKCTTKRQLDSAEPQEQQNTPLDITLDDTITPDAPEIISQLMPKFVSTEELLQIKRCGDGVRKSC